MNKQRTIVLAAAGLLLAAGIAYAGLSNPRAGEIVEFFGAHTHSAYSATIGAPQHSGGTDRYGCHNASVPYHCH